MRRFLISAFGVLVALLAAAPAPLIADSTTQTYLLRMGAPNQGIAPNGDRVLVTCATRQGNCGTFQIHPKDLPTPPAGEFVHMSAAGTMIGAGTWMATELLDYQSYGCGIVSFSGVMLPPNFCGGKLKMRVLVTPTGSPVSFDGILTVFCIVGPNPPNSHDEPIGEGVTLDVFGVANFNHTNGGMNIYIKQ
jgi:hypothetical protein